MILISTEPMKGVELQVLDYQQQIIAKATSDGDGLAMIDLKRKPYLLIAKQGNQFGYLKLDDGSSLPLGRFDVSGDEVKNGIKGYIFGERGVWRPGDSLFLSCIINDKNNRCLMIIRWKWKSFHHADNYINVLYKPMLMMVSMFSEQQQMHDAPTGNWICQSESRRRNI